MNKSLELNFWPILYDNIVFLCLQTQKVYLKQNIILLSGWTKKLSSKLLFRSSSNSDGFYTFYISQVSVATPLRCDGMFGNHFTASFSQNAPVKKVWKSVNIWQRYGQNFAAYFFGPPCIWQSILQKYELLPFSAIIGVIVTLVLKR